MAKNNLALKSDDTTTSIRIMNSATKLFASKGYEGTSTKEICADANVNIAAVHYHFESKEKLLRTILENFGAEGVNSIRRILKPPSNHEELKLRLQMFLEETLESFLKQPELWRIVQTEVELLHSRSADVFQNIFLKRAETLTEFLKHAKKQKLIDKNIDPLLATRCLFSQLCHQVRIDHVHHKFYGTTLKDESYRNSWVKHTLNIFINGICEK